MTEDFWRKIDRFLKARTLIPVLGAGAVTFGGEDALLRPWMVAKVADALGITGAFTSLHAVVCAHLRAQGSVEDVCLAVDEVLDASNLQPGRLLLELAAVSQCRLFFTLAFDPLLERALNVTRGAGRPVVKIWNFSLDRPAEDLPATSGTVLGYLFGKASPNPGFHLWDADAVEFVYQLQRQLPALNHLGRCLAENNLLIIGAQLSDWMVRFLFRAIRQRPLTEGAGRNLLLADAAPPSLEDAVIFYDSLKRGIEVLPVSPVAFAHEFCRRAAALEPPLTAGMVPGTNLHIPLMEPVVPDGSVFISYAHSDAAPVFRLVEKLRAAGCVVWLDDERLTCGDNFENNLEDAVRRHCGFFVSAISLTTESRNEAYFHKERRWAAERFASMPEDRPFYFPVVIDAGVTFPLRHEPRAFAKIDAERAPGGECSQAFVERLADLQRRLLTKP